MQQNKNIEHAWKIIIKWSNLIVQKATEWPEQLACNVNITD